MKNCDYYVVESPMQVLSAVQARKAFGGEAVFVFLKTGNLVNNFQVVSLISKFNLGDTVIVEKGMRRLFSLLFLILSMQSRKIQRVFIGDYRSIICQFIAFYSRSKEHYVLDDGIAIWSLFEEYIRVQKKYIPSYSGVKKIVAKFLISCVPLSRFSVFTCLPITHDDMVVNYKYDFSEYVGADKMMRSNYTCIIGSPLIECEIVHKDSYLSFLKDIYRIESKFGRDIIYIPHRRESSGSIRAVEMIGFRILMIDLPVELYFLSDGFPIKVIAFNSAVLYNLASFNLDIDTRYYQIYDVDVSEDHQVSMRNAYDLVAKVSKLYNES